MEPDKQIEIQLGHMCNNRCVFCVSGQETALGRAGPVDLSPILARLGQAHADGHRKLTLLGGEPTLQPGFLAVVRRAVELGFEEIVIFTNGAKTARGEFIDEILATGGRFTWRISLQGATRASHDRTTKKLGAFDRIVRTLENLHERGQRVTVNMCVVRSNYASIAEFPALLLRYGVSQLHLDMIRPLDAGQRTEDELREMMVPYPELVPLLERMIAGFPAGFDVNLGNIPYCIAPHLARWIHHDGQATETIAADGDGRHSEAWDKYLVKRRDKAKPAGCERCVFHARCSGVFDTYARFYGTSELVPLAVGPSLAPTVRARLERLYAEVPYGSLRLVSLRERPGGLRAEVDLCGPEGERAMVWIAEEKGRARGGYDLYGEAPTEALAQGLSQIIAVLRSPAGGAR